MCEIFKYWPFQQSKYVNNVCKLLQLLEGFVSRLATGASPWKPCWTSVSHALSAIAPTFRMNSWERHIVAMVERVFYRYYPNSPNCTLLGRLNLSAIFLQRCVPRPSSDLRAKCLINLLTYLLTISGCIIRPRRSWSTAPIVVKLSCGVTICRSVRRCARRTVQCIVEKRRIGSGCPLAS